MLMKFDYDSPAELFMCKRKGGTRQPLGCRRFGTAASSPLRRRGISAVARSAPGCRSASFDVDGIERLYGRVFPLSAPSEAVLATRARHRGALATTKSKYEFGAARRAAPSATHSLS